MFFSKLTIELIQFRAEFVPLSNKVVSLSQFSFLIGERSPGFRQLAGLEFSRK